MFSNLRTIMKNEGVKPWSLAKSLGVHRNTLVNKLSGKTEITLREIKIICDLFKRHEFGFIFAKDSGD